MQIFELTLLFTFILFTSIYSNSFYSLEMGICTEGDSTIVNNDMSYFGQTPPGKTPEIFAPGVISEAGYRLHSFPTFSPDYKEIYWAVIPPQVLFTKKENQSWTEPQTATFSERNIQSPIFSNDGRRIYFQMSKETGYGSVDIWFVEKTNDGWSIAKNLGSPPNSEGKESQPSLTSEGDIYFIGPLEGVAWEQGIYYSRLENDNYIDPILLKEPINTEYIEAYPFIAPDESFLLFSSSRPSTNENELKLFISFRNKDGSWKEPINLSEKLGLKSAVRFGCISPDKKYLFYLMDNNIYWIDVKIIEELK